MKLAKREKLFIGATGCIIGIFLIMKLALFPFFHSKDRMEKDTEVLKSAITDMWKIDTLRQASTEASAKSASTMEESMLVFMENAASSAGFKLPKTRTSESSKEENGYKEEFNSFTLKAVTWPQLIDFLVRIEKPEKNIFINNITIKDSKGQEGYLEAEIRLMTYKKVNG